MSPAIGDVVALDSVRYRISHLHTTDGGPLARLTPVGGLTWAMADELRWDARAEVWRPCAPETEAEAREAGGR